MLIEFPVKQFPDFLSELAGWADSQNGNYICLLQDWKKIQNMPLMVMNPTAEKDEHN